MRIKTKNGVEIHGTCEECGMTGWMVWLNIESEQLFCSEDCLERHFKRISGNLDNYG